MIESQDNHQILNNNSPIYEIIPHIYYIRVTKALVIYEAQRYIYERISLKGLTCRLT